jgi:hypothetical protein
MQYTNSYEPFAISVNIIRRRLAVMDKNQSAGTDNVSGQILKLGWEVMIPYLALLLDIAINTATIPSE